MTGKRHISRFSNVSSIATQQVEEFLTSIIQRTLIYEVFGKVSIKQSYPTTYYFQIHKTTIISVYTATCMYV